MIVHSYARFSHVSQETGDSLRRQSDAADEFCKRRGYSLSNLKFTDKGKSGFKGNKQKALNAFLKAVENGIVNPGEMLLVENVDRLSRRGVRQTQNLVNKILDSGINIAILTPVEKIYRASDENDIGSAIELAAYAFQAHTYSKNLSSRVKSHYDNQRNRLRTGQHAKLSSIIPGWLEEKNGKLKPKPSAVRAVKYIFKRTIDGIGRKRLIQELNEKFEPISTRKNTHCWNETYVAKIIKERTVLGEVKSTTTGESFENYYPAIIDEKTWMKANAESKKRNTEKGSSKKRVNLFNGLLFHAIDNCSMGFYTYSAVRANGKRHSYCRYKSYNATQGVRGSSKETFDVEKFENLVFEFLPTIEIETVKDNHRTELVSKRDYLQSEIDELQRQISQRTGAGAAVLAIPLADLAEQLEIVQKELQSTPAKPTQPTKKYRATLSKMRRGTLDERKRVRDGIREIVQRITVLPVKLGEKRRDPVKVMLEIEFKNGEFVRAVELESGLASVSGQIRTRLPDQCKNGFKLTAAKFKRICRLAESIVDS